LFILHILSKSRPAEPDVAAANQAVQSQLPFSDRQDFEDAMRGFIATTPDPSNPDRYAFLEHEAPPTVNPSLWRQVQLNAINGLFQVTDGVYQVRDYSVANMTIVEGKTGIVVIDTLASPEAAREALDLYSAHRPRRPVVAIIYSHGHGDHYGGASGVVSSADVAAGKTTVIAPVGFMEAIAGEAVVAGNLTARRADYQFGTPLPRGERGPWITAKARSSLAERAGPDPFSRQTISFGSRWRPALSMEYLSFFNLL
jgi:alkyl sulfatase BDS1-like metallo-beta-lactamase superfamily hydrolase